MFTRFEEPSPPSCGFCHIPYDELNMPFPTQLTYCYHCRRQKVITILCLAFSFQAKFDQKRSSYRVFYHPRFLMCCSQRSICHQKRLSQERDASSRPGNLLKHHFNINVLVPPFFSVYNLGVFHRWKLVAEYFLSKASPNVWSECYWWWLL